MPHCEHCAKISSPENSTCSNHHIGHKDTIVGTLDKDLVFLLLFLVDLQNSSVQINSLGSDSCQKDLIEFWANEESSLVSSPIFQSNVMSR